VLGYSHWNDRHYTEKACDERSPSTSAKILKQQQRGPQIEPQYRNIAIQIRQVKRRHFALHYVHVL
jgi:hypothetical protein